MPYQGGVVMSRLVSTSLFLSVAQMTTNRHAWMKLDTRGLGQRGIGGEHVVGESRVRVLVCFSPPCPPVPRLLTCPLLLTGWRFLGKVISHGGEGEDRTAARGNTERDHAMHSRPRIRGKS